MDNDTIIEKFIDRLPLARKYGLKKEMVFIDPDTNNFKLKDEYLNKFLDVYNCSLTKDGINEIRKSNNIDMILRWMNEKYDEVIIKSTKNIIKKANYIDYIVLSKIINTVIRNCNFSTSVIKKEETNTIGKILNEECENVNWDELGYDIYTKLVFQLGDSNLGVCNCIEDNSIDILELLKVLKSVNEQLSNVDLSNRLQDRLLFEKLNDLKNDENIINYIHERLYNEGLLDKLESNLDDYFLGSNIVNINNNDIIIDDNFSKGIEEKSKELEKLPEEDVKIENKVEESEEIFKINPEVMEDFKELVNKYNAEEDLKKLSFEKKEDILWDLFALLFEKDKSIYNVSSPEFDVFCIAYSVYKVVEEYEVGFDAVYRALNREIAVMKKNISLENLSDDYEPINLEEDYTSNFSEMFTVYDIFNNMLEIDINSNLNKLYESTPLEKHEELNYEVLDNYSKFVNGSMYGTKRDSEETKKQFEIFCSEHGIDYNEEFINSLPEIVRDEYRSPIIVQEVNEIRESKVFCIKKRLIAITSEKNKKRLYAILGGLGIMSFAYMTEVKLISTSEASESCCETFRRLFNSEMFAEIFDNGITYFASIAATLGGIFGYVSSDEKTRKLKK